jgi:hypothetical protein
VSRSREIADAIGRRMEANGREPGDHAKINR